MSGISNKLYDISDTEILVYNKYRMQFLEAINEEYGNHLDERRGALYKKKLADLGRLQSKEESELIQEKSLYKKTHPNKIVICDRCGEELQSLSKTCPSCGNRVKK